MSAPSTLSPGQVLPLVQRIDRAPDPAAVLKDVAAGRGILLESADDSRGSGGTSLVVTRAALVLECRGDEVALDALTPNGEAALAALAGPLGGRFRLVERSAARARYALPADARPLYTDRERLAGRTTALDALRILATAFVPVATPIASPVFAAGLFAYDLIDRFEELPLGSPAAVDVPDLVFWLPEHYVRIDHARGTATAVALVFGAEPRHYHDGARALDALAATCRSCAPAVPTAAPAGLAVTVDTSDEAYAQVVTRLQGHIVRGDVFQIVPSRTFRAPCADPFAAYLRLRRANPSPYLFYLAHRDWTLFGASPETCLKVAGTPRRVTIRPIAGTRPRGRDAAGDVDPDLDARYEADLRLSAKELAEHVMLVDLARNDVARVSRPGTRRVDQLMSVERYSRVMHLVSTVSGELAPELDALHAYAASMNMGTLVGAPKLRAAQLLREHEPDRRGAYGGAVGYVAGDGGLDTCIVIRAALVAGGVARVRAGAGVVADSDPAAEADETFRKASAVLEAIAGRAWTGYRTP